MKKKLILVVLFVIMIMPAAADSGLRDLKIPNKLKYETKYKVTFHNISDKIVNFYFYQIDHNLDISDDMMRAGGEISPRRSWSTRYSKGKYYVVWEKQYITGVLKRSSDFVLKKDMDFYYP